LKVQSSELLRQCAVVACGTLRREVKELARSGILDGDKVFFTAPGLHEWPARLEQQLRRQLDRAASAAEHIVVVYGEMCYVSVESGALTDDLIAEFGPTALRVGAKNCVDMLAGEDERNRIAEGAKTHWLTAGWIEHWDFIFKDWDAAKANETFPANDRAIVLDAVGYLDELAAKDPEKILRISDWMKLPVEPHCVSLDRLVDLLLECARSLSLGGGTRGRAQ
jgi:hypothetical protein